MNTIIFPFKEQEINIKHKINSRAKRLSLRFVPKENAFVLTAPPRASEGQIKTFLADCTLWIEKHHSKMFHVKHFKPGEEIVLHGIPFQCVLDPLRRKPVLCKITQTLWLPAQCSREGVYAVLKRLAQERFEPYLRNIGDILGQNIEKITFRDTKSRWGSCSARKTISLSWRLILVPPEVAHYVCVHEAVHLLHMNHSKAFWEAVETLCPTYRDHKIWLKNNGMSLMSI